MAASKLRLYTLEDESSAPECIGSVKVQENETYSELRARLEAAGVMDFRFEFWDCDLRMRIRPKLESLNDVGSHVYVIPAGDGDGQSCAKRRRVEAGPAACVAAVAETALEVRPRSDGRDDAPAAGSTRVTSEVVETLDDDPHSHLLSDEVVAKYVEGVRKLRSELAAKDLEDHNWAVKLYDSKGVGVVQIYCSECHESFGGTAGDHSEAAIHNLFADFQQKHMLSDAHARAWCTRKGIPFSEHPQSQPTKSKPAAEHKLAVEGSPTTSQSVDSLLSAVADACGPLGLVGDPGEEVLLQLSQLSIGSEHQLGLTISDHDHGQHDHGQEIASLPCIGQKEELLPKEAKLETMQKEKEEQERKQAEVKSQKEVAKLKHGSQEIVSCFCIITTEDLAFARGEQLVKEVILEVVEKGKERKKKQAGVKSQKKQQNWNVDRRLLQRPALLERKIWPFRRGRRGLM